MQNIEQTKKVLLDIADKLYRGAVAEGIADIGSVISDLSVIAASISDETKKDRLLNEALVPILSAMEEEDGTLLADLITYELVEFMDEL